MIPLKPMANLATHDVTNMPPHLGDQDLWRDDAALSEGVAREGGGWAEDKLAAFGKIAGAAEIFEKAYLANRHTPELKTFYRYGMRINQVAFHPAYHDLMAVAIENEVASFAWNHPEPGSQVAHAALTYMFNQAEGGVLCPMAMTYSAIPALRTTPEIGDDWIPRLLSTSYDPRDIPVSEKTGATIGMFMTEKQGGSDVRSNTTRAVAAGERQGQGSEYRLSGHKFFCSAPMSDAFLTLAYTDVGLSCFLVPRWTPDGERNNLFIQRLKEKLGNRSNASSEIELQETWGLMVGEDGRGLRIILDMVQGNRFYCCFSSAALMRQGLVQALHHTTHRSAFQKKLIRQPLMRNVLADLALEAEAALALTCVSAVPWTKRMRTKAPPHWPASQRPWVSTGSASERRGIRSRPWNATAAPAISKIASCRGCTAKRPSTASGKVRATSSAWTCCAPCSARKPRCLHSWPSLTPRAGRTPSWTPPPKRSGMNSIITRTWN